MITSSVSTTIQTDETAASSVGLIGTYFPRSFIGGTPVCERVDAKVDLQGSEWLPKSLQQARVFAVRWMGQLRASTSGQYSFAVWASEKASVYLWVDNQLMWPNVNPRTGKEEGLLYMPLHEQKEYALRVDLVNANPDTDVFCLSLRWRLVNGGTEYTVIPPESLVPLLTPPQIQREALRGRQEQGWGTFVNADMLSHALLPEGLSLGIGVYNAAIDEYIHNLKVDRGSRKYKTPLLRAGPHSYYHVHDHECQNTTSTRFNSSIDSQEGGHDDGGSGRGVCRAAVYTEVTLEWYNLKVAVKSLSPPGGRHLVVMVEPLELVSEQYSLVLTSSFAWGRVGSIEVITDGKREGEGGEGVEARVLLEALPAGAEVIRLYQGPGGERCEPTSTKTPSILPLGSLTCPLTSSDPIIFSTTPDLLDSDVVRSMLASAREAEVSTYSKFGSDPEVVEAYEAMHTILAWLTVYEPLESIITPISKGWDFGWGYSLFEWDNYFGSAMMALDVDSKDMAYSTLIQVTQSATTNPDGTKFVPNWASGRRKSFDRTEPPVGVTVLRQVYERWGDRWVVELLFDDMLLWLKWMWTHRRLGPHGLIAVGSTPAPWALYDDDTVGTMQGARYESGQDNAPMYDGELYGPRHCPSDTPSDLMCMYDVGMSSLFASQCQDLAALAEMLGRDQDRRWLLARQADMLSLLQSHLWDASSNIFRNAYSADDSFVTPLGPTGFFPMLSGMATAEQVQAMVTRHLANVSEFCVTKDCPYFALPSVSRSDPTFGGDYWRGRVWSPLVLLLYWGLSHPSYTPLACVQNAREALVQLASSMVRREWRAHGHVHENYDATTGDGDNVSNSDPFHHWGALGVYVLLLEKERQRLSESVLRGELLSNGR